MNNSVRAATLDDADDILRIYSPYITNTSISFETEIPAIEQFASRLERMISEYPYLVCQRDGKIVGFAYASKHRERAAYKYSADVSIYVDSLYHRQGVATQLYTALFELLKKQKIYTVYAGITTPNDSSIGLHKSFGFSEIGIYHNVGYKFNKWHDVIWLEKALREYDAPNREDAK